MFSKLLSKIPVLALIVLSLFLCATPSSAQLTVQLSGDLQSLRSRFEQRSESIQSSTPSISGSFLSFGPGTVTFRSELRKDWRATFSTESGIVDDSSELLLLSGELRTVADPKEGLPVAGSIYLVDGVPTLHLALKDKAGTPTPNVYFLSVPLHSGASQATAALEAAPLSSLGSHGCDTVMPPAGAPSVRIPAAVGALSTRVIEFATDADFEWFSTYGVNANNRIATLVNAANVVYERDLNLRMTIVRQNVWSTSGDPYTSTAASTLLTQFVNYTNSNQQLGSADLYHLFTGRDLDGGTVGIAYVGVTCSASSFSYGLTQRFSDSIDWIILAHEVGHNMDADHDDATPNTIMNASLSFSANSFSATSQAQVGSYVASFGGCLSTSSSPTPTPTATPAPTQTPTPSPTPNPSATPSPSPTRTPSPTATATPAPTVTPAPTANPPQNPTPEPPAEPDPRQDPPTLQLRLSYSPLRGTVSLVNVLSPAIEGYEQCELSLLGGESMLMSRAQSVLLDDQIQARRYQLLISRIPLRVRSLSIEGSQIYLQTVLRCDGEVIAESPVRRITVPRSSSRSAPTRAAWIRSLLRRIG